MEKLNRPEAEWTRVQDPKLERARGALWGLFIGDALAMPAHWYYDRAALRATYGEIRTYLAPRNPHPDSVLWRSSYVAPNADGEILHDQAVYWGRRGVHYHQFLQPGENTLNLKLAALLMELLAERGSYDSDAWLVRYMDFLRTPGRHADTYIEECHRGFFSNFARGVPLRACAVADIHIGGLSAVPVLAMFYRNDEARALAAVREHVALTHNAAEVLDAAERLTRLLISAWAGAPADSLLMEAWRQAGRTADTAPDALLRLPDEVAIGQHLSPACYIADAWPAVLYLAAKYVRNPVEALVANTMVGGDNCHRGAALGALLGAVHGEFAWPEPWRLGLKESGRYEKLFQALLNQES